jgi:hypothetical protein
MNPLVKTFIEFKLLKAETKETARVAFLTVRETLTRLGIASRKEKTLFQSCHILHKQGQYYIVHFKEMLALDGKPVDFTDEDKARRNAIVKLLIEWKLIQLVGSDTLLEPSLDLHNNIKVLHFDEKKEWKLVPQYVIGRRPEQ